MTAAQALYTDDPRHYERVLYTMSVIGDPEDRPPLRRSDHEFCTCWECSQPDPSALSLFLMSQDQDDSPEAAAETLAPPTDREAKTNPDNEKPEPRQAMNPPPKRESYFEEAARDFAASLIEMRATRTEISKGFRDQEDKQSERHAETTANQQMVASAIRAHGDRLIALERGADQTLEQLEDLKEEIRLARVAADEAVRLAGQALKLVSTLEEKLDRDAAKRATETTGAKQQ